MTPDNEPTTLIVCPPPCSNGKRCREEVLCAPETCPHGQKGWRHVAYCIKHHARTTSKAVRGLSSRMAQPAHARAA